MSIHSVNIKNLDLRELFDYNSINSEDLFFRNLSEVTHINRQRYMAELSKLLAFMFKEDREDILEQYNKLLDEAEDEQALLESFGSPTKLAVTISRTYRRSERKLAVEADSKADKPAAEHLIVTPVKKEKEKPQTVDTTLSYADIIEEIRREKAAEEGVEYKPMFFDEPVASAAAEEAAEPETPENEAPEEAPAEESAEPEQSEEAPAEESEAPAEAGEEPEAAGDEEVIEETEAEQAEAVQEPAEEVEELSAGEETLAEEAAEETEAEQAEEAPTQDEQPAAEESEAPEEPEEPEAPEAPEVKAEIFFEEPESGELPAEATRYKTNVALLILYLIFAIPIGLVLLALSVVLTLTLLGLGVLVIAAGAKLMSFAFSSLVIFADIMLCAGAVLISFAAALILLWLGILMLVYGIRGVAGGVVSLGRRLCVKEVSVNG